MAMRTPQAAHFRLPYLLVVTYQMPLKPAALLQLSTSQGLSWVGLKIDQNRKLAIHIPIPNFTNKYQKVVKKRSKNLRQGCRQMVGPKYRSVSTSITT